MIHWWIEENRNKIIRKICKNFVRFLLSVMMPVFQQAVLGIFPIVFINLVGAVRFSCSSNPKCTCYKEAGLLFADCENLDLIRVPSFNADVGAINLANNRISGKPSKEHCSSRYLWEQPWIHWKNGFSELLKITKFNRIQKLSPFDWIRFFCEFK